MSATRKEAKKTWYQLLVVESLIPLLLICLTPALLIVYAHFAVICRSRLAEVYNRGGLVPYFEKVLSDVNIADPECWTLVIGFAVWSAVVPLVIGGKVFHGPPTKNGFRPEYIDSAWRYFLSTTVLAVGVLLSKSFAWSVYSKIFHLTCTTSFFGFLCCFVFFVKGYVSPSPGEHATTGNPFFDFYWGKELYPRFGRWLDLKEWAISFYGMMGWFLVTLVCWKAQYEQIGWNWAMSTATVILTIYMAKFYWWYYGYCHSLDIIHDRTGFYLGWGGIGLMPTFLACNWVYMVENPSDSSPLPCLLVLGLAVFLIFATYWADMQRLWVRESDGQCRVWGRPARVVRAHYKDDKGLKKESLLLASGFWGVTRHPNYVIEFAVNLLWMLPAKTDSLVPYFWGIFLLGILAQRIGRDDNRCKKKYGKFWDEYCELVPYRVIPGIL